MYYFITSFSLSLLTAFCRNIYIDSNPGEPYYSVNIDKCVYKKHSYDNVKNEHSFQVERGQRFYLQLELHDLPDPLDPNYKVTLTREKAGELQGVSSIVLVYHMDSVDIQIATKQHEDYYKITTSTKEWEASLHFDLDIIEGMYAYYYCNWNFFTTRVY